jgi:hypothetical protein
MNPNKPELRTVEKRDGSPPLLTSARRTGEEKEEGPEGVAMARPQEKGSGGDFLETRGSDLETLGNAQCR